MIYKTLFLLLLLKFTSARLNWEVANTAFDQQLYEDVLDPEECDRQVRFLRGNTLMSLQFADAGIRVPRGLLIGNNIDLGNYYQCLGINHNLEDMHIEGKYCMIRMPLNQTFHLPLGSEYSDWAQVNALKYDVEYMKRMEEYNTLRTKIQMISGNFDGDILRTLPLGPLAGTVLSLGVCIPKPCTTHQAMTSFLFNLTAVGFEFEEVYCRIPNDKPRVAADYVAIVVFSVLGLLTVICTSYDLYYTFYIKIDRKQLNPMYSSFSVYTNGKRLMNFPSGPGNLQCLDGMRSLAMLWVIIGHSFSTEKFAINVFELFSWVISLSALWITSATISVDTFFTIAGVLLVYTTAGKMNGMDLLKNLHIFYLNRLLRMFPLLAAAVLLQASFFNRMLDGPAWTVVSSQTNNCRTYWWTTLLHVQNLLHPENFCISHSWYIAIDIQLYVVSPLILFWVLSGKKRAAWIALILGLLVPLTAATIYNFINEFPAGTLVPSRLTDGLRYMYDYYFFTLTRAPPFFVGMIFGYVLHLYRNEKVKMHWLMALCMWICTLGLTTTIFFSTYFIKQLDWDNQLVDNLMNSFMRPAWGAAICWIIFACSHGYGGPINWFLSLNMWRLPSRLSYAMFIYHYPLMFAINDAKISTNYFGVPKFTLNFLTHATLTFIVSYLVVILIDSPFSSIFKRLLTRQPSKQKQNPTLNTRINEDKERAETENGSKHVNQTYGSNQAHSDENEKAPFKASANGNKTNEMAADTIAKVHNSNEITDVSPKSNTDDVTSDIKKTDNK